MATTPTINPSPSAANTPDSGHFLVPHTHPYTAITGLRFGSNGRVEPVYDAADVYANNQLIALYNAATPKAAFAQTTVEPVTIQDAVQNEDGDNTANGRAKADEFLAAGKITKQEYDSITKEVAPTGTGTAPVSTNTASQPGSTFAEDTSFTYSTVLTPNGTTLGDMIQKVSFPRTIAQLSQGYPGMTPAQIVANLSALAINIWEPLKKQYPRAFMTNSFRHGASIGGGQHGTGQAMDVQFRGVNKLEYYDIAVWIGKNLPYDQLLLEYLPGKTVWIHVSFASPGLPNGGISISKTKPQNKIATLNGAAGGKFVVNLHKDIIANSGARDYPAA